jgi:hypothetical protein
MIDLYNYTHEAFKFSNPALTNKELAIMTVIGLVGECAEFNEVVPTNKDHVKKELGDICWYLSQSTWVFNLNFGNLMKEAILTYESNIYQSYELYESIHMILIHSCKILEHMKKVWFHDHEINRIFIEGQYKEIFKHLFIIERCLLGKGIEKVLDANIKKLSERYPHGFTSSDSINRKDGDETFKEEMGQE